MATREVNGKKAILPVWHGVGFDQVRECCPVLADRLALTTDKELEHVVARLLDAVKSWRALGSGPNGGVPEALVRLFFAAY